MKLLKFRLMANGNIRVVIHLDTTKVDAEGNPDPAWVYELTWPQKPANLGVNAYRDQIKQESKLLAQVELAKRQTPDEGTAVAGAGEGATF